MNEIALDVEAFFRLVYFPVCATRTLGSFSFLIKEKFTDVNKKTLLASLKKGFLGLSFYLIENTMIFKLESNFSLLSSLKGRSRK